MIDINEPKVLFKPFFNKVLIIKALVTVDILSFNSGLVAYVELNSFNKSLFKALISGVDKLGFLSTGSRY